MDKKIDVDDWTNFKGENLLEIGAKEQKKFSKGNYY